MGNRKVILYSCCSIDGYLATQDDDLSWTAFVEKEGEDYGYAAFNETVDAYFVGKNTYDVVLNLTGGVFPSSEGKDAYVITRTAKEPENNVEFYTKPVKQLLTELKAKEGKNIYCDGGAQVIKMLLEDDLIDEFIITYIPLILGDGKRLFKGKNRSYRLELAGTKQFKNTNVLQVHYRRNRNTQND